MPRFAVDVRAVITVEVAADDAAEAIQLAKNWVRWLSPTYEQLEDYLTGHAAGVVEPGDFIVESATPHEENGNA